MHDRVYLLNFQEIDKIQKTLSRFESWTWTQNFIVILKESHNHEGNVNYSSGLVLYSPLYKALAFSKQFFKSLFVYIVHDHFALRDWIRPEKAKARCRLSQAR